MLATKEENLLEQTDTDELLTFYEKIKIKNNMESLFNHHTGSYVFIETNPWTHEYTVRGKFHVKYDIFSKFEINFKSLDEIREYSDFIESLAFIKNYCEENVVPILSNENELTFLYKNEKVTEDNIVNILNSLKKSKESELFNVKEEIKVLYNDIEDVDNEIKDKKEQIKFMEVKIREVKEAASSLMASLKYITITSHNSLLNRIKGIFVKEQLKLGA
ncbi:MAG: hypothetical protein IJS47_05095 [Clostridia bacterium]|nr:hypothetical protein [Clostridia bacterium]